MLDRSGKNGHPCLTPDFRGNWPLLFNSWWVSLFYFPIHLCTYIYISIYMSICLYRYRYIDM
jgi:hypothetical protein